MQKTEPPRLKKLRNAAVWHCRSDEYWGCGATPAEAYTDWKNYIDRIRQKKPTESINIDSSISRA